LNSELSSDEFLRHAMAAFQSLGQESLEKFSAVAKTQLKQFDADESGGLRYVPTSSTRLPQRRENVCDDAHASQRH
jgi:uncharacterized protein YyaL (SSP411 family)